MRKREWKAAAGDMMKEMRVVVSVVVVVVVVLLGGGIDMARAEVVEADVGAYSCPGEGEYVFRTWTERIADASGRSVQFPKDDAALAALLKLAEEEGRHVRVTGASHSINGIVMNSGDNAMVVSLACYEPPADSGWRLALDTDTGYVSAPAGYSLLDVVSFTRPLGFIPFSQSAGIMFTLGGVVANHVHGGTYTRGFLYEDVEALRVMLANGEVRELQRGGDGEMKHWLGSFGLLGIITGVRLHLEKKAIVMDNVSKSFAAEGMWTKEKVMGWIRRQRARTYAGGFFLNPWNKSFLMLRWKEVEGDPVLEAGASYEDALAEMKADYAELESKASTVRYTGTIVGNTVELLARTDELAEDIQTVMPVASAITSTVFSLLMDRANEAQNVMDGYYLHDAPKGDYMTGIMPAEYEWEIINSLMQFHENRTADPESDYYSHGPLEFRYITVADDVATLQEVPAGEYITAEVFSVKLAGAYAYARHFSALEQRWVQEFNMKPHLGKEYGYCQPDDGATDFFVPFCDKNITRGIFTSEQKTLFENYRSSVDPAQLFYAGGAVELVDDDCETGFEWRNREGQRCDLFGYGDTICQEGSACEPTDDGITSICTRLASEE